LNQSFQSGEVLAICGVEIVCQVDTDHKTRRRRVDTHAVGCIIEVFRADISFDIVRIVVAIPIGVGIS
jgi:hypothetical protein